MSAGYRCDKCGQFRDGAGLTVEWAGLIEDTGFVGAIDLCPACAPAMIERLEAIAETKHEASP